MSRFRFIALWLLLGAAACGVSEEAKRAEVASVTVAIDRLRDAPNGAKGDFLAVLKKTPCSLKDVCQLRDSCASAYSKQVEALQQIAQMKDQGSLADDKAASFLAIQEQLTQARDGAKVCVDAEARVLDRYRAK